MEGHRKTAGRKYSIKLYNMGTETYLAGRGKTSSIGLRTQGLWVRIPPGAPKILAKMAPRIFLGAFVFGGLAAAFIPSR